MLARMGAEELTMNDNDLYRALDSAIAREHARAQVDRYYTVQCPECDAPMDRLSGYDDVFECPECRAIVACDGDSTVKIDLP